MSEPLPLNDKRHLEAAEAWSTLGNLVEAFHEFLQVSEPNMMHPGVIQTGWLLSFEARSYQGCKTMARAMVHACPDKAESYDLLAITMISGKEHEEAYQELAPVAERFPESSKLNQRMAVCACQTGRLEESLHWLERAFDAPDALTPEGMKWKEEVWHSPLLAPAIKLFEEKYMKKQD